MPYTQTVFIIKTEDRTEWKEKTENKQDPEQSCKNNHHHGSSSIPLVPSLQFFRGGCAHSKVFCHLLSSPYHLINILDEEGQVFHKLISMRDKEKGGAGVLAELVVAAQLWFFLCSQRPYQSSQK